MEPERYTLEEAARLLALRECQWHGHNLTEILIEGDIEPRSLMCSRCGEQWAVVSNVATT